MKQLLIGVLLCTTPGFFSCKKENTSLIQHDVTSVTGPTVGNINTGLKITVTYPYNTGCDRIGSFEQTVNGNIITIKAYALPVSKQAFCTMDVGFRTIDYNFSASGAGTYELRFLKTDGGSINHSVTLQ